ncbi:MAG: DUF2809 domain-containing protein [Sarcina sp.]
MNIKYSILCIITLLIEVFIAFFVRDNFIRPYIGDLLVVVVIYFFIRSFTKKKIKFLPIYIFIFAIFTELMQYINILGILGLEDNKFMSILVGSVFDFKDILCYLIGCVLIIIWEQIEKRKLK